MKIFFLDFEASSLAPGSYPIEIAWVGADGRGESYLIQPYLLWSGWSSASELVHRITPAMLRDGTPAEKVARRAQTVLSNALIVSDQPVFERHWLAMLLAVIGAPPQHVVDVQSLIGQEIKRVTAAIVAEPNSREWHRQSRLFLDQAQMVAASAFEGATIGRIHKHRALPDAEELWRGWRAVVMAIDRLVAEVIRQ